MRRLLVLVRLVGVICVSSVAFSAATVAVAPRVRDMFTAHRAEVKEFELGGLSATSLVFSSDNVPIDQLKSEVNRKPVRVDDVSPKAVKAVLAVEDAQFYEHSGINARSITRALVRNVSAGGVEQGGSTLTQQLIKNSVLGGDNRDLNRKIPEAVLALRLEKDMSKHDILELYMNTVYFGGGAYGIQAAAETYFNKFAGDLDWPESAMLAAMINNPNRNDPTINPERAIQQRSLALKRLVETGDITEAQRKEFEQVKLPDRRFEPRVGEKREDGYFLEEVKQELLREPALGATVQERRDLIYGGGLRVYTTIDTAAQLAAERAVREGLPVDDRDFTAALAAIEPATGAVRAMVGGPGFDRLKFNIATSKGRQTGSAFKTFVLAAAMEQGVVPSDTHDGTGPCVFDNTGSVDPVYIANNFNNDGGSFGTVESLTLRSSNCGYLRIGQTVGISNVVATSKALGITANLPEVLSLPLGVVDITPLDMAAAYASIANDGRRAEPYYVERIEDRSGKVIFQRKAKITTAISVESARRVTQILAANVQAGTGTRAKLGAQPSAGKTGTTQDFTDAWFVGYTPYLATAVWMGNANFPVEMRNVPPAGGVPGGSVTGGSFPAAIWGAFNRSYHEGRPVKQFSAPEPSRPGRDLRTAAQINRGNPCGTEAPIDDDGDGVPERCSEPAPDPTTPPTAGPPTTGGPPTTSRPSPPTTGREGAAPPTTTANGPPVTSAAAPTR